MEHLGNLALKIDLIGQTIKKNKNIYPERNRRDK